MSAFKLRKPHVAPARRRLGAVLNALTMAAPFALAVRFTELSHCYEASLAGVHVLRKHGISAEVVPCLLVVRSGTRVGIVGGTDDEASAFAQQDTIIEYITDARGEIAADDDRLHAVIVAEYRGLHALVDLTAGQARATGVPVPLALSTTEVDLDAEVMACVGTDTWDAAYCRMSSSRAERIRDRWAAESELDFCSGLADDLDTLSSIALATPDAGSYINILRRDCKHFERAITMLDAYDI